MRALKISARLIPLVLASQQVIANPPDEIDVRLALPSSATTPAALSRLMGKRYHLRARTDQDRRIPFRDMRTGKFKKHADKDKLYLTYEAGDCFHWVGYVNWIRRGKASLTVWPRVLLKPETKGMPAKNGQRTFGFGICRDTHDATASWRRLMADAEFYRNQLAYPFQIEFDRLSAAVERSLRNSIGPFM